MEMFVETLQAEWTRLVTLSPRIMMAGIVIALSFLIGKLAGGSLVRILRRSGTPHTYQQFFSNVSRWAVILVGSVVALNILGLRELAASLVAGGGVMAVVLGFTFRGVGENFLAGFFLVLGRTFKVGDLIQSGEFQGVVRRIELRYTHVRASDGRDIFIPSYEIFSKPMVNYTRDGLRRVSFNLGLDYASDLGRAREVLGHAIPSVSGPLSQPGPMVRIQSFEANYVLLDISFWIDTFSQDSEPARIRTEVMDRCRQAVLEAGFTVSSEVGTNLNLHAPEGLGVRSLDG